MLDAYGRTIDYLRISITDRCNFRCAYCMPPEGIHLVNMADLLTFEEIVRIVRVLSMHGVNKIRLTGGEPLVRRGMIDLVRSIGSLEKVEDLAMTTNGSLLAVMAKDLKAAGLDRVNISVDTVDAVRFGQITGAGKLADVLNGVKAALAAGLAPVKLNVVLTEVLHQADVQYFVEQVYKYPVDVRFIEYMPIGDCQIQPGASIWTVKQWIESYGKGKLQPAVCKGGGPAKYFRLKQSLGSFGFITPVSEHFCQACNRIRLTADGKIKPCLLANTEIDIKTAMRAGANDFDILNLFESALRQKSPHHNLQQPDREAGVRYMTQIGG